MAPEIPPPSRRIALVTSFFTAAPADEVANNVRIALANAANPDLYGVCILLQGSRTELVGKLDPGLLRKLTRGERAGRIRIQRIGRRPDYLFLFRAAVSIGREVCAVANADILLRREFTTGLLADYDESNRPFLALTRWNRTANGLFIQGQISHPPWQEVPLEELDARQVNYLSFDFYCFDRHTLLPRDLRRVLIGTFGCDTAVSALMRLAGVHVSNPCLAHRIEHIDDKLRDYTGDRGDPQMAAHSMVVKDALLSRFTAVPPLHAALMALETLPASLASFGIPLHRLGCWFAMKRLMGAAPWRSVIDCSGVMFQRVEFHVDDVRDRPQDVLQRIAPALDAADFIELEIRGHNGQHYMECMQQQAKLRPLRERLARYDRQSVLFVDMVSKEQRRIHADILRAVRCASR